MPSAPHIEILARAVCVRGSRVLLCRTSGARNTYLPGGHVEFGEPARAALQREIAEELGLTAQAGRFLGAAEHRFEQKGAWHAELNLLFATEIDGLDPDGVADHKKSTSTVADYPRTVPISEMDIITSDVDILIPAALENVITAANAGGIKARIVAELANGPTTPEADEILYEKGVHLIPDFLCNAGGVTVSYFEMVQNMSLSCWTEEEVYQKLDGKMTAAYRSVLETSGKLGINMRKAAYVVAVERVIEAMRWRGWV